MISFTGLRNYLNTGGRTFGYAIIYQIIMKDGRLETKRHKEATATALFKDGGIIW